MLRIRRAAERGHADRGWLDSYHTFSFGEYHDPDHMGFRSLRVINEDRVQPGQGFGTHPHRDMEIVSYVVEGALAHRDSTGTEELLRPGEVQRMTAGTGITHSEYNGSRVEPVHFLQIWILPERRGLEPGYEQKLFPDEEKRGRLRLLASPEGEDGSVTVHQDVRMFAALLQAGEKVEHALAPDRHAWVQVVRGSVTTNGVTLSAGDGAAVSEENRLELNGVEDAEVLLFDLS